MPVTFLLILWNCYLLLSLFVVLGPFGISFPCYSALSPCASEQLWLPFYNDMHSFFFKALVFRALIGKIKGQCLSTLRVHTAVVCVICGQNQGPEAPLVFLLVFQGKQYWESFSIPLAPPHFLLSSAQTSSLWIHTGFRMVLAQLHLFT